MRHILATIVLLAVVAPAHDETPTKTTQPPSSTKPITVPFELLKSGHMAVQVKVNDKGPYRLIFDTGAPITLLNNKIAKEAGLLKGMVRPLVSFFGNMGEVKVKKLQVGEQQASDVAAIVMDHPTVEAISKVFGPIDGIVGFPFFARFTTTLDYQAKTLTFTPNGFKPPDVMKAMMDAIMSSALDAPTILTPAAQWGMLVAKADEDESAGVRVTQVFPGSAAEKGTIHVGDRLLTIDGRWTDTLPDLYAAAMAVKAETTVTVLVSRDGKEMRLKVKPTAGF